MSPEFLQTTLIVVATPGAGALYTIAAGVSRGWRAPATGSYTCSGRKTRRIASAATQNAR
jgi:threonine/homoserine/homoserine lactone efflux protein